MFERPKSKYEGVGLRAVRPYLIVSDADRAIDFYQQVFEAYGCRKPHPAHRPGTMYEKETSVLAERPTSHIR